MGCRTPAEEDPGVNSIARQQAPLAVVTSPLVTAIPHLWRESTPAKHLPSITTMCSQPHPGLYKSNPLSHCLPCAHTKTKQHATPC